MPILSFYLCLIRIQIICYLINVNVYHVITYATMKTENDAKQIPDFNFLQCNPYSKLIEYELINFINSKARVTAFCYFLHPRYHLYINHLLLSVFI